MQMPGFLTERPGGCWDIGAFIPFVCETACDHLFRLNNSQTTVISVLHSCSCLCTYMHVCVKLGVSLELCEDYTHSEESYYNTHCSPGPLALALLSYSLHACVHAVCVPTACLSVSVRVCEGPCACKLSCGSDRMGLHNL